MWMCIQALSLAYACMRKLVSRWSSWSHGTTHFDNPSRLWLLILSWRCAASSSFCIDMKSWRASESHTAVYMGVCYKTTQPNIQLGFEVSGLRLLLSVHVSLEGIAQTHLPSLQSCQLSLQPGWGDASHGSVHVGLGSINHSSKPLALWFQAFSHAATMSLIHCKDFLYASNFFGKVRTKASRS